MRSMLSNINLKYSMEICAVYCAKIVILFIYLHSSWIILLLLLLLLLFILLLSLLLIRYEQLQGVYGPSYTNLRTRDDAMVNRRHTGP